MATFTLYTPDQIAQMDATQPRRRPPTGPRPTPGMTPESAARQAYTAEPHDPRFPDANWMAALHAAILTGADPAEARRIADGLRRELGGQPA